MAEQFAHPASRACTCEGLSFVGELAKIEFKPGDRFVLSCDRSMSKEEADFYTSNWERFMGPNAPSLMIITEGMRLHIITEGQGQATDGKRQEHHANVETPVSESI